jgi:hypothetical protein
MDLLPEDCIRTISQFLTPSEQDHMITLTLLAMDDFSMCLHCGVHVASWKGRCHECHMNLLCPECCLVPSYETKRYLQPIGVYRKEPNVCESCYRMDIPHFLCFFCDTSFFALDGHRIVIESDHRSYEQVICMKCIHLCFSLERWKQQWVSVSIRPSSYGAKLWFGPPLPLHQFTMYELTYRNGLLLFMQQSKSETDILNVL